jgi:hypothetical protein
MAEIKLFKQITGLEVIGELVKETETTIQLKKPLIFDFVPQDDNSYGLNFSVYSLADPDGKHEFNKSGISSYSISVPDDIEKSYIKQTSGISIISSVGSFSK